jgi:sulfur-carrier protein adenylyltransferase/sulfurtransferase
LFSLTSDLIVRDDLVHTLKDDRAGALCVFEGWVRDHNQGKKVSSLEYQVYEALALKEGQKILHEALQQFNLHKIICVHRFGHLRLGEAAVWIGATATHRDDAFKATRFVIDQIKLRLPIWKKEHYVEEKPEWVFCKDHHTHVHFHEADYYQKQAKLVDQALLKSARVLVVGAGGLGCPVLMGLATAGVGHIDIADFDTISLSNLHRQPLYGSDVVGEKKAIVAKTRLLNLNPFVHVHSHDVRLDATNVESYLRHQTLVIDATDNLESKYLLHDACMKARIPLISASIYQFEGQIRTFVPGETGCLRCIQSTTPEDSLLGNCNDFGVLGSSVLALGSLQANEAILWLTQGKNNTTESTFLMNLKSLSQMKLKNLKKENCSVCDGHVTLSSSDFEVDHAFLHANAYDVIYLDVREKEDSALNDFVISDKKIIVACHRGVRSKRLVQQMRERGHPHFYSLRGGARTSCSH